MRKVVRPLLAFAFVAAITVGAVGAVPASDAPRRDWSLDAGWRTFAGEKPEDLAGFERADFNDSPWQRVGVPHNWDDYGGLHGLVHGNRHGSAGYRREFDLPAGERGRRVFLFFEGVGSYATVWVNGKLAGTHAGGRTTFTLRGQNLGDTRKFASGSVSGSGKVRYFILPARALFLTASFDF